MIWDPHYECMSREDLQAIQLDRLQATVNYAYEKVPYYKALFDEHGVHPQDIKRLEDVHKLPFTGKEALAENYPFGMFAVPMKDVVRLHASSGTTGKQKVVGYTKRDIRTWANLVARIATMAGVTDEDIAQICFGYGLFTGGFGLHYGLEKIGATIIPASTGNTERQITMMQDFGTTALVATPSYALYMAEVAEDMGVDTSRLKLRVGLFGSEPCTESMRKELERRWHIRVTDNYGLTEIGGPGVAGECECGEGMHINEDHFYPEIINPETGEVLGYGEEGELVFTSLTREAFPIIRYRTRDISMLINEPCKCGRTTIRMKKLTGRTDDMLIIRGVNVYPSQIETVLLETEGVAPHYQLIVTRKGYMDDLEVLVEVSENYFTGKFKELEELESSLRSKLNRTLGISARVKLVESRSIERTMGKAKRIIDLRSKD
ncbi:AMP-dependent synthetase and ligase [Thermincola ferriacetica]|uniref:Phenylacetate-coenzyme A ligase n=1 Tax=Thermincola ferriacetica TaxID=281456 RepID=A0A0L6W2K9_9FIRM|nr:phenylacetate--CoA ligase [Thermincola ferriacetica]KNZ69775.1 AMP-dependent synthetase and ligase [Thermincola ferriacetica]